MSPRGRGRPRKRSIVEEGERGMEPEIEEEQAPQEDHVEVDDVADEPTPAVDDEPINQIVKKEANMSDEEEFIEVELDDAPSTSDVGNNECGTRRATTQGASTSSTVSTRTSASNSTPKTVKRSAPAPVLSDEAKSTKKKRVPVPVGTHRTRAATMHALMVESMKTEVTEHEEVETEGAEGSSENPFQCYICKMILQSTVELAEHRRAFHKDSVNRQEVVSGSLMCAHPHCSGTFPDVAHLIAHLVAFHNQQQYRMRKIQFDRIDKFEAWHRDLEANSRCSFIASQDPEGESMDLYRVQMYCEFCDEWRRQSEKGPANPQQIPKTVLGCPAHFTATIDNKKDRASVVGCFAHLGHHKKPSWSVIPCDAAVKREGPFSSVKCRSCDMTFRSAAAATRHHRHVHDGVPITKAEPKLPSLECGDPECDIVCDSMATLVQHVSEAHRRDDLSVEEYKFNTLQDFESWKLRMEADTCSRFTRISGREMKHEASKYYLCHLSGHTNRSRRGKAGNMPEEKQRNRPTKKMGRYCTAFMSFKHNKRNDSVSVRGCLGHFGHPYDVRRLPVPELLKKEIADLLLKGCSEDDIVQLVRSRSSESERGYWLQRYEVRNISLKLQREGTYIKNIFQHEEDEREWEETMAVATAYHMNQDTTIDAPSTSHFAAPQFSLRPDVEPVEDVKPMPMTVRFKTRSLAEIHASRRRGNGMHSGSGARLIGRGARPKLMMPQDMEVVEYVDAGDYTGEGEIVEMREVDGMLDANGAMYYGEAEAYPEQKVVSLPHHLEEHASPPSAMVSSRKRMPLLKEPAVTGNPEFDDLMSRIKDRIDKISLQLKVTQDVAMAEDLLKELKSLEGRLVSQGVGQTTVPALDLQLPAAESRWTVGNEEYYGDYQLATTVEHEEEVNDDGTDTAYSDYMDDSGRSAPVDVEGEEVVD